MLNLIYVVVELDLMTSFSIFRIWTRFD